MIRNWKPVLRLSALVLALATIAGCGSGSTEAEPSRVEVTATLSTPPPLLDTDRQPEATDYEAMISSAEIQIERIYLVSQNEDETPVDLLAEGPVMVDLVQLQEGDIVLAEAWLPAERYGQLRLLIEDARVNLAEGYSFEDGSDSRVLKVPSGMETGIKVNLQDAVQADLYSWSELLIAFDLDRNFVIQKSEEDPTRIKKILFTPVLKEAARKTLARDED